MKRLIVNADDSNFSWGVSRGIIEAFREGVVTSTTVMVNLPGLEETVDLIKDNPELDVGLHVNLTFGRPVLPRDAVPSLTDPKGNFWRGAEKFLEKARLDDMKKEIHAQFCRARELRLPISHLDSHHHIHRHREILGVLSSIARKEKIAVRAINAEMREELLRLGIPTTDFFTEELYGMGNATPEKFSYIIQNLGEGVTEFCCHPGHVDEVLKISSSYVMARENELAVLTAPDAGRILEENNVQLIGFRELLRA
ncbi:MAG: ChbG/HpnK family deacetylase [bacterium]